MAATFDDSLTTLKDHIRLALGDTTVASALLSDESIEAKLALFTYSEALAQLAEALVSKVGQEPDKYSESGALTIQWSERIKAWKDLIKSARAGEISEPKVTRLQRNYIAIQETDKQIMKTTTERTDPDVATVMEGFRSD